MSCTNLAKLLDALTETSIYVIERDTHRLLYFNQRCRETGRGRAELGRKCHEVWPEVCANCPLDAMGDASSSHLVCFDPLLKKTVDVTANRILWDDKIPAIVVTATPHRLNFEEEQGLEKIEKIYAQSLVTVFDECIIANLTADYYVNCQKDTLWTDIPKQGQFGAENRKYAEKTVHPDDLAVFEKNFSREGMLHQFQAGKRQISKQLRRLTDDGTYHMVEFTATRIEQFHEEVWCVLVFRDIHEEYEQEQQKNMEISQLATAARTAYQMLIAVNLTQNTYHMVEYGRYPVQKPDNTGGFNDLIEAELSTVHPDYQGEFRRKFSRQALIEAFTNGERIVSMEVPHYGADGVYHWHFTQVVRVESTYTDDLIEITLSRNVDQERRERELALEKERAAKKLLEEALQKAEEANSAKSDFLSRMSHDIRTPMNAIIGMTELAQINLRDEAKLRDYLGKIQSSSAHLLGLINEVLDVSKIENGAVELEESEFDLRELVQEAVSIVQLPIRQREQELILQLSEDLHTQVVGDKQRLRQVLVNVLDNASKYNHPHGKIRLSLEELKETEFQMGMYRFIIEDNGIGMKREFLEHIFEPFSRADDLRLSKVTGTGLGMTIVQNLVAVMGGTIQVESEYGKGTRFTVTLSLCKREARQPVEPKELSHPEESFREMRVLLVEDNELNRQIATEMLRLLGTTVETAENGREAVEAVCGHQPFYYDVVFMDIQMPVMNGYEACKAIRASRLEGIEELPIIALTADAFAEDARKARLAMMSGHLSKPISMDQLRRALEGCLRRKHQNHPKGFPKE